MRLQSDNPGRNPYREAVAIRAGLGREVWMQRELEGLLRNRLERAIPADDRLSARPLPTAQSGQVPPSSQPGE